MRNLLKVRSAQSLGDFPLRKFNFFRSLRSHSVRVVIVGVLTLMAVAASWVGLGSPGKSFLFGLFDLSVPGLHPGEMPNPGIDGPAAGRLTIAERAAMAILGGVGSPEKAKLPNALRQPEDGADILPREQALITALETGTDAEALEAIRGLAALGGELNHRRLAAIMKDNRWTDALRTEAARALLASDNPAEAQLAVRVLAVIGGDANTDSLKVIINNASLPKPLRLEAALAMGIVGTPRARDTLINAFRVFPEPEIHEQILGALGQFPFTQIESTWKQILGDPNTPAEVRVAAVDALANSSPDALPFLKTMAGSDRDPQVREMSAWAISALPGAGENELLGPDLARMAKAEPEADVRRRLYEALPAQVNNPSESLLPVIQGETDYAARVAGFDALADTVKRGASSGLSAKFDAEIVPELTEIAVSNQTLDVRTRAVFALRRANTPAARQALQTLSQTPNQKIALAARHGLKSVK